MLHLGVLSHQLHALLHFQCSFAVAAAAAEAAAAAASVFVLLLSLLALLGQKYKY